MQKIVDHFRPRSLGSKIPPETLAGSFGSGFQFSTTGLRNGGPCNEAPACTRFGGNFGLRFQGVTIL